MTEKREHHPHPYRIDKPTGCDIEGCLRPHYSNGLCVPHWQRRQKYGDPLAGPPLRKQRTPSARTGTRSEYHTKHLRVRNERGPAWQHMCEHCDRAAETWAMERGTSGDVPEEYMALCWSCHAKYDNFADRLPDNIGSRRSPESRERIRQAALLREARKRGEVISKNDGQNKDDGNRAK